MKVNTPDNPGSVLGIDVGSVSLAIAELDQNGNVLNHFYKFHRGNIRSAFSEASEMFDLSRVGVVACTSSSACLDKHQVSSYNPQVAIMAASKHYCKTAASVLHIGAEKYMLIRFDDFGNYQSTRTSTSCAAGTGSFLDQQTDRLGLSGVEELCEKAQTNKDTVPPIASRCAVFSNTDIIHAQQRGHSVGAICESLCKGLAENIINTVFNRDLPHLPLLITGGVSKNPVVRGCLEKLLKTRFLTHRHSHLFGAIGAALILLKEMKEVPRLRISSLDELLTGTDEKKEYYHKPLSLVLSNYPDFSNEGSYLFKPVISPHNSEIEIDLYTSFMPGNTLDAYLGIDIGSTSTKAILTDGTGKPVAGFYTYTTGKPLSAVKSIFEAIANLSEMEQTGINITGAGTTGSGRKFIGKIINADLIVDEITSHARAAWEINPDTDTIVEIGGQDAKFTLMKNGSVTFSQMNSVCAAGTGSFLHEQARKLGCSLSDYMRIPDGVRAPLTSDRCTVFMERDLSQLYNSGYSIDEILATALHSVTENYLKKVATEASIGQNICFQGATAKNRALVAAFEQRLKKPIHVSKYCHLTGALGAALILRENHIEETGFRGLELFREEIAIETEICKLCSNNCCISLAEVSGERVAYGFMCGRDYETRKFVSGNQTGFDLIETRKKLFEEVTDKPSNSNVTIGLPASLHLFDELYLWKRFFKNLSVNIITSEKYRDPVKTGKSLAGAEFCAPINSIFGHVAYLSGKADYIFLPVLLQGRENESESEGQYCYYTQYAASLVYTIKINNIPDKCLSPLLNFHKGKYYVAHQLHKCLKPVLKERISYITVLSAFSEAVTFYSEKRAHLSQIFRDHFKPDEDISVALLGRPYLVMSEVLNKGIPGVINSLGVKAFYQDMIPPGDIGMEDINVFLKSVPWYFVNKILETARVVAEARNLYPVLITAFKCAPDSFIIEYFKRIFNKSGKPYLILQIDEHDSNVGYETRIEAAVRSFRNHSSAIGKPPASGVRQIFPSVTRAIADKTLLLPRWDPVVSPLLVANMKRIGIDARLLESSELTIKKSMAHNTGQCLPINIIAQEAIEYVQKYELDTAKTLVWAIESKLSCNLRLYPQYIKSILENYGEGMEKINVYSGFLTHLDISVNACINAYFAYLLGGLIRMTACRIRPYELVKGETNRVTRQATEIMESAFMGNQPLEKAVVEVIAGFDKIAMIEGKRPKVAIFGDFYVCDNEVMNQKLAETIEESGGEVIATPYTDFVKMTLDNVIRRSVDRGEYLRAVQQRVLGSCVKLLDNKYYKLFEKYLGPRKVINPGKLERHLASFNINPYNSGESYDNILKIFYIIENYPGVSLFVQANPAFCCPSLVTEAMTNEIRRITGIPIVTLTYDGTNDYKNDAIIPYLQGMKVSRLCESPLPHNLEV
jgi:predicted CoA-substrate-specific enzyme activase